MSMMQIKISESDIKKIENLQRAMPRPSKHFLLWGQSVTTKARKNARAKGGKSFWREVAQATVLESVSDTSAVVANYHVAGGHKQTGGVIRAKNAKALTIPITEEAKRKRAGEFAQGGRKLFVIPSKKGDAATKGILGYSDGEKFYPLFVLRTRVEQAAEPWFPSAAEIANMGVAEGLRLLAKAGVK